MRKVVCTVAVALLGACTYAQLNARGQQVALVDSAPRGCQNLGPVVGKGGGGGGGFVPNEDLIEYAMNDARNKAGDRGATHLTYSAPGLGVSGGQYGSSVTSATVTGIAYRCADGAAPTAAAAIAPQPGPASPPPVTRAPSAGTDRIRRGKTAPAQCVTGPGVVDILQRLAGDTRSLVAARSPGWRWLAPGTARTRCGSSTASGERKPDGRPGVKVR